MREYLDPSRVFDPRKPVGRVGYLLGWLYLVIVATLLINLFGRTAGPALFVALLVPALATLLSIRRLRDLGLSGWHALSGIYALDLLFAPGQDALFFVSRGNVDADRGKYDRAIAYYTRAIEINPAEPLAFINRGSAYGQKGQYHRAVADLSRAVELDPTARLAFSNRAAAYIRMGDYGSAIADCDREIELDQGNSKAYAGRATANLLKGAYDLAIADCDRAIALDPENTDAYASLRSKAEETRAGLRG
jgi:tetratricopeptide (TPR) repeat protein